MKEYTINKNEAGQRFDKYLGKLLSEASMGFIFKMLRKKNFTLNDKKADGKEILKQGDVVKIFLADETFEKFSGRLYKEKSDKFKYKSYSLSDLTKKELMIIYEDDDILIFHKPAGMLSQKAKPEDVSANEYLIGYLLSSKQISFDELQTFKPSVANRLDRNTSGILLCGKSLQGSQYLSSILKDRSVHKYYKCIVAGKIENPILLDGYLVKDSVTNTVKVSLDKTNGDNESYIKTDLVPIAHYNLDGELYTELEIGLITGKPHQIRAHLSSIGHPLLGDSKYGSAKDTDRKFSLKYQLLHAYKICFPISREFDGFEMQVAGQTFYAELPNNYQRVIRMMKHGDME